MTWLMAVWWVGFVTAVGLCVGSFLNVVIYRLPNELSVFEPKWSFCPQCHCTIRWYDNLPLVGYLRLGGRCRGCGTSISVRYPVVEGLTALVALALFDALIMGGSGRAGLNAHADMNWRVLDDWPVFLAHFILFSCLLAMSVIDLEHFWVDVRFTTLASLAGILLHGLWTPGESWSHPEPWSRPHVFTVVICGSGLAGLMLAWGWGVVRGHGIVGEESESPDSIAGETVIGASGIGAIEGPARVDSIEKEEGDAEVGDRTAEPRRGVDAAWTMGLAVLGYMGWMVFSGVGRGLVEPYLIRVGGVVFLFFVFVTVGGMAHRESESEIVEAIDFERHSARKNAIREFVYLMPAILLGVGAFWCFYTHLDWLMEMRDAMHVKVLGQWRPLLGVGTAVSGLVIAAGLGWLVRIGFTLVLGKEAFGTGDIHLMAAAGAVAGWQVVLIGFFLSAVLALMGWVIALPVKRARAIPFGPWLSLAFLVVCVFYGPIMNSQVVQQAAYVWNSVVNEVF